MRTTGLGWGTTLGLVALAPLLAPSATVGQSGPDLESITTFYVVRHAEKVEGPGDVALRKEGYTRAVELRDLMSTVPLAAVYSTNFTRTRETAGPTAEDSGIELSLYPPADRPTVAAWTQKLIDEHRDRSVLIVSHSGGPDDAYSVASIVHHLSGMPVMAIPESDYDNLFEVTLFEHGDGDAREIRRTLQHHHYGPLSLGKTLQVDGELEEGKDISAVVSTGNHLIVGADEADAIQTLRRVGPSRYEVGQLVKLGNGEELDIESLARVDNTFYVLGSHSRKRKKVEPHNLKTLQRSYAKNRQRLRADAIESEVSRRRLYRFDFDPASGEPPTDKTSIDLSRELAKHEILKVFHALPSKENGIDIEGLAVAGDTLYLGFRAPVLRSGFAPVLRLKFDQPKDAELLFVGVGGRGIRELTRVDDGFLIIAGAATDAPLSYLLYHWDGNDMIPGHRDAGDPPLGKATLLGRIPTPAGAKAEGLAVLATADDHYDLLVAYDSVVNGGLRTFRAPRPEAQ